MSRRFLAVILLAVLTLATIVLLVALVPTATLAAPTYMGSDWDINNGDVVTRSNEEIIITGNVTVKDGGLLTLRNVTLRLNSSASQRYHVEVEDGGRLNIYDGDSDDSTTGDASLITANDTTYNYAFWVQDGGELYFNDSSMEECGVSNPLEDRGLYIASSSVVIRDVTIKNGYYGIIAYLASPTIEDCTIDTMSSYGVYLYTSSTDVRGCTIDNTYRGVVAYYSYPKVTNTDIDSASNYGIYIFNAEADVSGSTITNSGTGGIFTQWNTVDISGTTVDDAGSYGIISYYSVLTISSTIVNDTGTGIYLYRNAAGTSVTGGKVTNTSFNGIYSYLNPGSLNGVNVYDSTTNGIYLNRATGTVSNVWVEDAAVGIYVRSSPVTLSDVTVLDATTYGIDVSGAAPSMDGFLIQDSATGLNVAGAATFLASNGTITGSTTRDVDVATGAVTEITESSFSTASSRVQGVGSALRVFWFVDLHGVWQDATDIAGGAYDVTDQATTSVASGTLDGSGWARWLRIRQLEMDATSTTTDTPHTFQVTEGGLNGVAASTIDSSKIVTVTVTDNVAPSGYVMNAEPAYTQGTYNTVSWTAGSDVGVGGIEYFCQLATDAAFTSVVTSSGWIGTTTYTFGGLVDGFTYYYRVQARDGVGNVGAWSAGVSSTQDSSAPSVPVVVLEPTYTQGTSNTITWGTSTDGGIGGVEYRTQVTDDPTFNTVLATTGWQTTTSRTYNGLVDGTMYYYRVASRDGFLQESSWSPPVYSTQDNSAPTAPGIVTEPTYTQGLSNTIEWGTSTDSGAGDIEYYVEYDTQSWFPTPDGNSGWITTLSHTFNGLPENTWIYYHVRARDSLGQMSSWSALTWSRQDNSAPSVPVLSVEPAYTAGNSNTVYWSASSDGAGSGGLMYWVETDVTAFFTSPDFSSGWITVRNYAFSSLIDGDTYYFRVKAKDALDQESSWSATQSSTQDASAPPIPSIATEPTYTPGTTNTLDWSAVTDAGIGSEQYQIQASTTPSFTTIFAQSGWITATSYTFTGLSDDTTYYYHVHSRDGFSQVSDWSGTASSTQDANAPPAPTMVQADWYNPGLYFIAKWTAVSDAGVGGVEYYCEYDDAANFASPNGDSGWTTALEFNFTGLQENRWYYYHVKARDALGQESVWSARIFARQDNSPPTVPTMTAEPAWTAGNSNTVSWSASSDTGGIWQITYQVEIGTSPSFNPPLQTSTWITQRSYSFTGLQDNVMYYYHVRSKDGLDQESAWSVVVASTQDALPPPVPGIAPEPPYTAGTTNTIDWSVVTDAGIGSVRYQVEASTIPSFSTVFATSGWTTLTSYTFTSLTDGTTYYYRVRSRDGFLQVSDWSSTASSTQDTSAPPAPTMVQQDWYNPGLYFIAKWTAVSDSGVGGVEYYCEYDDLPNFASPNGNSGWTTALEYNFTGLQENRWYYYHVKARDALDQESAWSAYIFARQDNSPPTVPTMTAEPAWTAGTTNTVSWSASADTGGIWQISYQVEIGTSPSFSPPLQTSPWTNQRSYTFTGLQSDVLYYYHARAKDGLDQESAWSAVVASTQDASPPPAPTIAAEPEYTQGTSNTLSWTAVADNSGGTVQYRLQGSTSSVFATIDRDSFWRTTNTWTFTSLTDGTTYYYRVWARDQFLQEGAWSNIVSSTQDNSAPSGYAMVTEPTYTQGLSNTVEWTAATDTGSGSVEYWCEADDDWLFRSLHGNSGWTTSLEHTFTSLIENRWYYYRVRARDSVGNVGGWSGTTWSRQDNSAPTVPTMTALSAFTQGTSVDIGWSASTDIGGIGQITYKAQYASSGTFSPALGESLWQSERTFTFSGLADGQTYYFRVKARDGLDQESGWSGWVSTTMDSLPPSTPFLAPEPTFTQGTTNALSWSASADSGVGAIEYEIEASTSPAFSTVDDTSGWITTTTHTFTGLTDGTLYYYRVHARDDFDQESGWSNVERSTQDATAPQTPTITPEPTYTQGSTNTVYWSSVTDATSGGVEYYVEYDNDFWFRSPNGASGWISATEFTFTGIPENIWFYYHVQARDAVGNLAGWSARTWSRQDATAPTAPVMVAEPTYTQGSTNTVSWSASSDTGGSWGITYYAELGLTPSFNPPLQSSGWQTTTSWTVFGLSDGVLYYYRAKSMDAVGNEAAWSAATASTQDGSPPPTPTMAAEPPFTQGTSNTVSWTAVRDSGVGGEEYEVVASTSSVFASIDATSGWITGTSNTFTGLTNGATYYYRVHAKDSLDQVGAWSNIVFSLQDATAPPAPTITTEPTYTEGTSNTIYWSEVTDAGSGGVEYYLEYDNDFFFRSPNGNSGWISGTSHTFSGLAENTWWFYRVRARDAAGNVGAWSGTTWSRQDATAPTVPTMTAEPQYTPGTTNTVGWSASTDSGGVWGITYKAEVSLTNTFTVVLTESPWITTRTWTFTGLVDGWTYYYRVRARDALDHESSYSNVVSSTQDASAPTAPFLTAEPEFTSGTANTISWSAVADGGIGDVEYLAQRSTTPTFATVVESGWATRLSYTFTGLSNGVTYYYRVKARDAFDQEGGWSNVERSTQDAAAPTVPGLEVEPTFTEGTSNTLKWTASTDAGVGGVQYWIEYDNDFFFRSPNGNSGWITTTEHTFDNLAENVWWFYRVRARDAFGYTSAWSTTRWSRQDDSPPTTPTMRIEPSYTPGTSNTVQWLGSSDPGGVGGIEYQVLCDNDANMGTPIYSSGWITGLSYTFAGLADGVTYYYAVLAQDAFEHKTPLSNVASSTQDASPPSTPVMELEPEYTQGTSNTVSWMGSEDAGVGGVVYTLQWSESSVFSTVTGELDRLTDTSAVISSLGNGHKFYFRVRARDSFGYSTPWSNIVWSTQDAAAPPVPKLAEEPEFTKGTSNTVSWTAVKDAGVGGVQYYTEISTDGAFTNPIGSGWTEAVEWTWNNLGDGSRYWYRVRSRDGFGQQSGWSAFESSTQDDRAPPVPTMSGEPSSTSSSFSSIHASSGWMEGTGFTFSGLSDGVRYYYRVRSRDAFDHRSSWSNVRSSTQDASAPSQPSLAAEPEFTAGTTNTVSWSVSSDAGVGGITYFLQVASDGAFSDIVGTYGWADGTSATFSGLTDGVTYYYRVRARDAFGYESPWSSVERSTQDASPPSTPTMDPEPAYTKGTTNTVSWSMAIDTGIGGVLYYVEWDNDPAFRSPDGNSGWVPIREWTFGGLPEAMRIYYRVHARDALGQVSPPSYSVWSRQDNSPPTTPSLNELPEYTKGRSVVLSWNPAVDLGIAGVEYWAEWDDDPSFATPGGTSGWVSGGAFTFSGLPENVQLHFRVRARDAFDHMTPWAGGESTILDATPPTVPYMASEPLFTEGTNNRLEWSVSIDEGVGGIEYRAQATADASWSTVDKDSGWLRTTSHTFSGLADGTTFYYRVQARDTFRWISAWSPVVSSTQDASAPPVPFPQPEPSFTKGLDNNVAWSEVVDAGVGGVAYMVEASTVPTFSTVIASSEWVLDTQFTFVGLTEGSPIYFRVRSRDAFDQRSSWSVVVSSTQDASPPQIPFLSTEDEYTAGSANEISWLPVFDAGVGGIQYLAEVATDVDFVDQVATSGWISATSYTFHLLGDGVTYHYRVRSRDAFDHESGWSTPASSTQDASPPVVAFHVLPAVISAPVIEITGTASDAGSGVGSVQFSEDGSEWEEIPYSSGVWSWTWTGYGSGAHELWVRATDTLGNMLQTPVVAMAEVDLDAPEASISSPELNETLTGLVPVQGTAVDPHIARYNLYHTDDGVEWTPIVSDQLFSVIGGTLAIWDTRFLDDGEYQLILEVNDTSGRTTRSNVTVYLVNSDMEISPGDLILSNPRPFEGKNITVSATFRNVGTSTARDVRLVIEDNGQTLYDGVHNIPAGEAVTVSVPYVVPDHKKLHSIRAYATYEDNPDDKGDTATVSYTGKEVIEQPFFDTSEWALFFLIVAVLVVGSVNSFILWKRKDMVPAQPGGLPVTGATFETMEPLGSDQIQWDDDSF
jgi:hypothetical protein